MKREAGLLLDKALDSLVLAVEHFNRPWDRGRHEATLVLLDRAFELLLKAIILHRGGRIREARERETIGFDRAVRKCLTDASVRCLTEEQAVTVQMINSLRDAAQHYLLDISEELLYIYVQAGVTLFDRLLSEVFESRLGKHIPERVLPVCVAPPRDFLLVIEQEFAQVSRLVAPGARQRVAAQAKLRALAIIEASLSGRRFQPSAAELGRLVNRIQKGESWQAILPGVASLRLDTEGVGPAISIRLSKADGEAVHLVEEGTPGATTVAIKRVNELDFYSLGLTQLAEKVGLSTSKTLAVVRHLKLMDDLDYFKAIRIGKSEHKRYSPRALDRLKKEIPGLDMAAVWRVHRPRKKATAK